MTGWRSDGPPVWKNHFGAVCPSEALPLGESGDFGAEVGEPLGSERFAPVVMPFDPRRIPSLDMVLSGAAVALPLTPAWPAACPRLDCANAKLLAMLAIATPKISFFMVASMCA